MEDVSEHMPSPDKMFTNTFATDRHFLMPAKIGKLNYLPTFYSASSLNQCKLSKALFSLHSQGGIERKLKMAISMFCKATITIFFSSYVK